jgi:hypothetical protein
MATDGPDPAPCAQDIYRDGTVVHQVHSVSSNRMEGWVRKVAADSGQRVDWHFFAGWAVVKAIGDIDAVDAAIEKNLPELERLQASSMRELAYPSRRDVGSPSHPEVKP